LGRENFMGVSQRSRPPKISTTCFCLIYFSKIWHFEIHEYPLHPAIWLKSNKRIPSVKLHKIYSPTKTKSNLFRHFVTLQCYSIFHSQRDCFFKFNLKCVFHTSLCSCETWMTIFLLIYVPQEQSDMCGLFNIWIVQPNCRMRLIFMDSQMGNYQCVISIKISKTLFWADLSFSKFC
jgi:hypothetical protein